MCAKSPQSCPTLFDPMDCSPPSSSVHGGLPCPPPGGHPNSGTEPLSLTSPALRFFTTSATWEAPHRSDIV